MIHQVKVRPTMGSSFASKRHRSMCGCGPTKANALVGFRTLVRR